MSEQKMQARIVVLLLLLVPVVFILSAEKGGRSKAPANRVSMAGADRSARLDSWRIIGPGGGGAQFLPTISPHNPSQVLVACDMTGAYITHDAGGTWRMFNLRGRVHFFVFDPRDPQVIYAKATGLWRSSDGGESWHLLHPDPSSIERIDMGDDHADETIIFRGEPGGTVTALAVDPADSRSLYAVFRNGPSFTLQESRDQGKSWKKSADLPTGGTAIYVDSNSPVQDRTLYLVGRRSVSVRISGQWSEGQTPPGVNFFSGVSAGFSSKGGKPVCYALAGSSLFVSRDGGANWAQASLPGTGAALQAVATSFHHPETSYLSYSRLLVGGVPFFGVARTDDYGQNWRLVWKESSQSAGNIHDSWITARFGPGWGENPLNLGVAPDNPDLCYGTDYGRTMRTADGGQSWEAVYSRKVSDGRFTTNGLDVTTCYGVHFDPFDAKRIFITYTDIGLFRSEDGGRSWASSTAGVPKSWVNTTYWIVFDPEVRGRVWGVMSGVHDLPRPKMWRRRQPSTYDGGICISEDGGKTWKACGDGQPQMAATHILLDPGSPSQSRTLYVAAFGRGVFKSINGGKSWTLKNNGIEGKEPFAWRLTQDSRGALYLVVARRSEDGSIGSDMDGALYRSTDGAETWHRVPLPAGINGPNGLAVDPVNPQRLYLAAWGRRVPERQSGGGIFLSENGGASWRPVLDRDQHIYDVTIDRRDPKHLYACGFESSAWRSVDSGDTWERIRGFNFKWGHRVIPDPLDQKLIYISTYGGSVWHGPASGDPSAQEDIATPALSYH
jgi:photosystem II stability/assembly factor-like uncharacterized protein